MGIEAAAADQDGAGVRVGLVVATFNQDVTGGLLAGALLHLHEVGAEVVRVVEVPGAFEIPIVAQKLAAGGEVDAVVGLGAVIKGETDHYEHIAHRTSEGLMRVALDTGVPVAFGILTTRSAAHAMARSAPGPDNKGVEAAAAAIGAVRALESL